MSDKQTEDSILYRKAVPGVDDEEILSLYNHAYNRTISMEWFKWFNYSCPFGANRLYVAENRDTSQIVGAWGALPYKVKLNDGVLDACLASNAVTHPDYQHRGIFVGLNRFTLSQERELGSKVSLGVFGENDIWGRTRMGWEILGDLNFVAWCGARSSEEVASTKVERFIEAFNSPLFSFLDRVKFAVFKNHDFLNWRYFDRPDKEYHVYAFKDADAISGFVVLKYFKENGYRKAHILDIYFANEIVFEDLINTAKAFSISRNCHELNCWQTEYSPYIEWFYRRGFTLSPHKNTLKSNFGTIADLPNRDWWFMLGDYDVY